MGIFKKRGPFLGIIILLAAFICIQLIQFKIFKERGSESAKPPEYLSKEYIYGDYLYDDIFDDVKYFPLAYSSADESFYFEDSYGADRTYGGDRLHEGCDIMTPDNIRGRYPIVSVCDGVVENIGWLELGGYRIGIRSEKGVYYYYAHLYSYAYNLKSGDKVRAGDIIGFAGDSGYGKEEGTVGMFDVHLHFGIYLKNGDGKEVAINPYPLLKSIEKNKMVFDF